MADIAQSILQSVDNIISQRIGEVSFDRTLICTILEVYEDRPNVYWVSDGSTKFEAIALDDKTYKKNTRVYITVPQGDFNKQKIIVGAYTAETAPKYLYTNPMEYLVGAQEVIVDTKALSQPIEWNYNFSAFGQYNTLGLEMAFETSYTDLNSEFLLKLQFNGNEDQILVVSSKDLYGIPNNLISSFKFNQLLTIPEDYIKNGKNTITVSFEDNTDGEASLSSLSLFLGYNKIEELTGEIVSTFKQDTVKLFPSNITPEEGIYYYSTEEGSVTPVLSLEWFHAETDKIYSAELPAAANYSAYWCKQEYGYTKNGADDIEQSGVNWKTIEKVALNDASAFGLTASNLPTGGEVKYKVLVVNEDTLGTEEEEYYVSNVLTLTNKDSEVDNISSNTQNLILSVNSLYHNIYGMNGKLTGYPKFSVSASWIDSRKFKKENWIRWSTSTDSLITFEQTNSEGSSWSKEVLYQVATQEESTVKITYSFLETYNATSNNIIRIEYGIKDDEGNFFAKEFGIIQLYAGLANNKFSGYSFNLTYNNPPVLINNRSNSTIVIKSQIIDPNGNDITSNATFTWSWVNTAKRENAGKTEKFDLIGIVDSEYRTVPFTVIKGGGPNIRLGLLPNTDGSYKHNMDNIRNYHILKAVTEPFTIPSSNNSEEKSIDISLVAYLPIGFAAEEYENYKFYGPSTFIYESNQMSPKYLEVPYSYQSNENNAIVKYPTGLQVRSDEKINDFAWANGAWGAVDTIISPPGLGPLPESEYVLNFYNYFDGQNLSGCFYQQPLHITTNLHDYEYLTLWDGALDINAEKNHISSASMFVGEKVYDEQKSKTLLSGVLLGSLDNLSSSVSSDRETGLYGFEKGIERFKLGIDGSFFVGNGNNNYISFNEGNSRSGSNELFIKTNKFTLDAGNLFLTSNPTDNIVFKFSDKIMFNKNGSATIGGWNISSNGLDYNSSSLYLGRGLSGQTIGSNKGLNLAFKAGNNFGVTTGGTLYATGAVIEGTLKTNVANITGALTASDISAMTISADQISAGTLNASVGVTAPSINGINWSVIQQSLNNSTNKDLNNLATLNTNSIGVKSISMTGVLSVSSDQDLVIGSTHISWSKILRLSNYIKIGSNGSYILTDINGSMANQSKYWGNVQSSNNLYLYGPYVNLRSQNSLYIAAKEYSTTNSTTTGIHIEEYDSTGSISDSGRGVSGRIQVGTTYHKFIHGIYVGTTN